MSQEVGADFHVVRRHATALSEAASEMRDRRLGLFDRLAYGAETRPQERSKDEVKVTIGAPAYEHTGSTAGDLVATKLKSCGDAYTAVEEGLRAMATVMTSMADALERGDEIGAEELNSVLSDMYCVSMVINGEEPEQVDWFGLESA